MQRLGPFIQTQKYINVVVKKCICVLFNQLFICSCSYLFISILFNLFIYAFSYFYIFFIYMFSFIYSCIYLPIYLDIYFWILNSVFVLHTSGLTLIKNSRWTASVKAASCGGERSANMISFTKSSWSDTISRQQQTVRLIQAGVDALSLVRYIMREQQRLPSISTMT